MRNNKINYKYICPSCDKDIEFIFTDEEYNNYLDKLMAQGIDHIELDDDMHQKFKEAKCPHCGAEHEVIPHIVFDGVYAL